MDNLLESEERFVLWRQNVLCLCNKTFNFTCANQDMRLERLSDRLRKRLQCPKLLLVPVSLPVAPLGFA